MDSAVSTKYHLHRLACQRVNDLVDQVNYVTTKVSQGRLTFSGSKFFVPSAFSLKSFPLP